MKTFEVNGQSFLMEETGQIGFNSGRPRYKVGCLACGEVVHEATTGPEPMARSHLRLCQALMGDMLRLIHKTREDDARSVLRGEVPIKPMNPPDSFRINYP